MDEAEKDPTAEADPDAHDIPESTERQGETHRTGLSIVPAPRLFAYRRPVGKFKPEELPHPLRRRGDLDPRK